MLLSGHRFIKRCMYHRVQLHRHKKQTALKANREAVQIVLRRPAEPCSRLYDVLDQTEHLDSAALRSTPIAYL
jgi:hypothetical protein